MTATVVAQPANGTVAITVGAGIATILASPAAAFCTGVNLVVDGKTTKEIARALGLGECASVANLTDDLI